MISESCKSKGGGYLEHIVCFAHYGNTLMKLKINSRNGHLPVLHDSPRAADDDRRERLNMKKYGVWNFVILTDSCEMKRFEIVARSGKDAKRRVEDQYKGCEVLKMFRVEWLTGFSYAQLSAAILGVCPTRGQALLDMLADNGVFSAGENKPETVD